MILLDTCALLALQSGGKTFSATSRALLDAPSTCTFVSAITAFEIGQKYAAGKLSMNQEPAAWFDAMVSYYMLDVLSITASHALRAASLPLIHRDPFDRIVIATALEHNRTILTSDRIIPTYPHINTIW